MNLDKRPGESSFRKGFRYKSWDDRPNSPKSGMWIFKTSNGSKIARIAPILTILGRNRSQRPDLVFENFCAVEKIFVEPIRTEISARPVRDRRPDRTGPEWLLVLIQRNGRTVRDTHRIWAHSRQQVSYGLLRYRKRVFFEGLIRFDFWP